MAMDPYDARCREDQIEACRTAVAENNLLNLASGGVCTKGEYDIYDQLCTLNYFSGGTDYCCCAHARKALCCRFHYDHKYFRCDEEEDTISLPLSLTATIIISVIVTVVVAVVLVTIIVKCVRGRKGYKRGAVISDDVKTGPEDGSSSTSELEEPLDPHTRAPSVSQSEGRPGRVVSFSSDLRPEPTAPSIESDIDGVPSPPPYQRVESQPSDMSPLPAAMHGRRHELYRSESDNYEERRQLEVLPEPPPAYADHHEHPLYSPEINNTDRAENWL